MSPATPEPGRSGALRRRWRRWRRRVLAHRRLLAAACAALAVVGAGRALAPPAPPSVPVTVAARDLSAGTTLGPDDLTTVRLPPAAVPAGATADPGSRILAAPMRRGEPLTDVRLVSGRLVPEGSGARALPVRLPDAGMADLLAPGDVVDVLATDPRTGLARQVATDVTVLAIPRSATDLSGGPNGDGAMVVLEVDLSQALDLTGAALSEYLTVTL